MKVTIISHRKNDKVKFLELLISFSKNYFNY